MLAGMPTTTLPETLDQYAAKLDAETGSPTGFAELVGELYVARHHISRLEDRRKAVYAEVKVRFARGNEVVLDPRASGGGYHLREVTTKVTTYRAVESAAVKKSHPELWAASRVRKPWVSAKAPETYPVPELRLPPAGAVLRTLDLTTLMQHYKAPAFERIAELEAEVKELGAQLTQIAEATTWSGELTKFADGWTAAVYQLTYDSDELRRRDPKLWDRLAVEKHKGGVTRIVVTALDRAEEFGLVDLDGLDTAE